MGRGYHRPAWRMGQMLLPRTGFVPPVAMFPEIPVVPAPAVVAAPASPLVPLAIAGGIALALIWLSGGRG